MNKKLGNRMIFINQDSGYLMVDIINAFSDSGYRCVLITGRLIERNKKLRPAVKIHRIIMYRRGSMISKLLTWMIGFLQMGIIILFTYPKDELFIVSNPPIAPFLRLFTRNPFHLLIFDIYPDLLTEMNLLNKESIIIKLWKKLNIKIYRKAQRIFTISEGMKQEIRKYACNNEITVVPLWTDSTFLKPIAPENNPFPFKYNLKGKFIVMYSGNIGMSGNTEVLIDIASKLEDDIIQILIIGDGAKKNNLLQKSRDLHLKNVLILPWQPVSELPFSLSCADLAVILIGEGASRLVVPSKVYNFLSVGAPLLCLTSPGSELEVLVSHYECGKVFNLQDISGILEYILYVKNNENFHRRMKENSLAAAKDFSSENCYKFLEPFSLANNVI